MNLDNIDYIIKSAQKPLQERLATMPKKQLKHMITGFAKSLEKDYDFSGLQTIWQEITINMLETDLKTREKSYYLTGGVGTGKSTILKIVNAIYNYLRIPMKYCSMSTIVKDFQAGGFLGIEYLFSNTKVNGYGVPCDYPRSIIIDDVGIESEQNHFGNKLNLFDYIIHNRYDIWKGRPELKTHISTNLNAQEFMKKYDDRTSSRIHEMCLFFQVDYKNFRKTKKPLHKS